MKPPLLLAIETSGRVASVALAVGADPPAVRFLSAERKHTAELLPTIQELLHEHGHQPTDVNVLAYSSGPGSFTGLRVAATLARMLQSAIGCAVVAVSTLEVIARNALRHPDSPGRLVPLLDAKRGQLYAAAYERSATGTLTAVITPGVHDPAALFARIAKPFHLFGEGVARHRAACAVSGAVVLDEEYWPPTAEHVVHVARRMAAADEYCRPEGIIPLYLRRPECEEVYEQRRAAARQKRGE